MRTVAKAAERKVGGDNSPVLILPASYKADTLSIITEIICDVPRDVIVRPRAKNTRRWSICKDVIIDYCANSNIHGIRYISEVNRPLYERLYWIIMLVLSVCIAGSLIWKSFIQWQDTPAILGFDETLVPIHKIPFPTITICPEIKLDYNEFDYANISQRLNDIELYKRPGNFTAEEIEKFAAVLHICKAAFVERFAPYIPNDTMINVAQILVDLSNRKDTTNLNCKWNGRNYQCSNILNFVATDEGICYQFNGLQSKDIYRDPRFVSYADPQVIDCNNFTDNSLPLNNCTGTWSLDKGFVRQGYNTYPQRTAFSSARKGFSSTLLSYIKDLEQNVDYVCTCCTQGYKVYLNSPESVPQTQGGNYVLVSHGNEVILSVLPQYVTSTENLHDFDPKKRQCYFNDERYLKYFQFYSQSNCQTECLINFTISECGCAKFWMPKPLDVLTCGVDGISCYSDARKQYANRTENSACDCKPACNSLDYNFEISTARYDLAKGLEALGHNLDDYLEFKGSKLTIYFKERQFIAVKRTVLFSVQQLIAKWGSICALFMGISILSIIEVAYFFAASIFHLPNRRIRKQKIKKEEAGHEN